MEDTAAPFLRGGGGRAVGVWMTVDVGRWCMTSLLRLRDEYASAVEGRVLDREAPENFRGGICEVAVPGRAFGFSLLSLS